MLVASSQCSEARRSRRTLGGRRAERFSFYSPLCWSMFRLENRTVNISKQTIYSIIVLSY